MGFASALWGKAGEMAAATPASRNRTVDFLRAASIGVVVIGHWLMMAPHLSPEGDLVPGNLLGLAPWTQWLTLALQVMPIFFLVGGYSNAVAWRRAREQQKPYGEWLAGRIQRLIAPVVPVLGVWVAITVAALQLGAPAKWVGMTTQIVLVPTWFLAVYVLVGVAVPWTLRAWERFGFTSVAALAVGAAVTDVVAIGSGNRQLGMINYGFVWLAIHQLGHAWQDGRIRLPLAWAAAAGAALMALIELGPYPLAMVGVPGQQLGNTSPPTLALLALGITQMGLVLAAERPLARFLEGRRAWTATVLVNGMIMTLYLWHMTAAVIVLGGSLLLGSLGLGIVPDTGAWWATRPLWLGLNAIALVPLMLVFSVFERSTSTPRTASRRRLVAGASLTAAGLGLVAANGLATPAGLRLLPSLLPFLGVGLVGIGPLGWVLVRGDGQAS